MGEVGEGAPVKAQHPLILGALPPGSYPEARNVRYTVAAAADLDVRHDVTAVRLDFGSQGPPITRGVVRLADGGELPHGAVPCQPRQKDRRVRTRERGHEPVEY